MDSLRVLVLNSSYEPLHFCNARRAIVMLLKGKAENIESDGIMIRSSSLTLRLPTVIRLLTYIKISYNKGIVFSKKNVLRRDNYTCQYCGMTGEKNCLTIDHVISKSKGGKTSWDNVVTACQACNVRKGNSALKEAGMKLIRKPYKPKYLINSNTYYGPISETHLKSYNKYLYI